MQAAAILTVFRRSAEELCVAYETPSLGAAVEAQGSPGDDLGSRGATHRLYSISWTLNLERTWIQVLLGRPQNT